MLHDAHTHTAYSGDSQARPEDMIQAAMQAGLGGITFTDHLDLDYPNEPGLFDLDLPAYMRTATALQDKYADRLNIRFGIELGLQSHLAQTHSDLCDAYPFDFVIASSHVVHGMDPFYPEYYEGRSEQEAYLEYFTSIAENIRAYDGFDVYGHIDYVVRYGPNTNENYSYAIYRDIIDTILRLLIEKGRGIEVNTSGFRHGLGHPNPTEDILKRYREFGGEIITIGSDAHSPADVGYAFDHTAAMLRDLGFSHYAVFQQRKPVFYKL